MTVKGDDGYSAWMHHADEAGDFVCGLVLPWLEQPRKRLIGA